uniref:Uncharacterized protein n=1 Tax=Romanomermis culicivorax TaxID=13658 RepID=A0A915KHB9_ROMCU
MQILIAVVVSADQQMGVCSFFDHDLVCTGSKMPNITRFLNNNLPKMGLKIRKLIIRDNLIVKLIDRFFGPRLSSIETLILDENRMYEILPLAFRSTNFKTNLKHLSIKYNRLKFLELKSLESLIELESLDLSWNRFKNIDRKTLGHMPKLIRLSMRNNFLINIDQNSFSGLPNLKYLDLSGNRIENLDRGIFDPLPKLELLNLSHNVISIIFRPSHSIKLCFLCHLKHLDLSFNNLEFLDSALPRNLQSLFLGKNLLTNVPKSIRQLGSLKIFNFSSNFLSEINNRDFINLIDLQKLDLSKNRLSSMDLDCFKENPLQELYLNENRLIDLTPLRFIDQSLIRKIDISNNLWSCTCSWAHLSTSLKNAGVTFKNENSTFCQSSRQIESLSSSKNVTNHHKLSVPMIEIDQNFFDCKEKVAENVDLKWSFVVQEKKDDFSMNNISRLIHNYKWTSIILILICVIIIPSCLICIMCEKGRFLGHDEKCGHKFAKIGGGRLMILKMHDNAAQTLLMHKNGTLV